MRAATKVYSEFCMEHLDKLCLLRFQGFESVIPFWVIKRTDRKNLAGF